MRWPRPATFGATPDEPKRLALGREAFPINTGHLMPPGTDAVIMVEQIPDPEADPLTVEAPTFPWQHVRRVGEDLVKGEMVLPEGVEITPWAQGALLAAGVTRVLVRRRPRVAIIPTGTELVPGDGAGPGLGLRAAAGVQLRHPLGPGGGGRGGGGGLAHRPRRSRGPGRGLEGSRWPRRMWC